MDTSFFIKAFSASPSAVVPGYVIGGIAYFAIPWAVGTIASSICLGLETTSPIFPTYPRVSFALTQIDVGADHSLKRLSSTEIGNGLVLPYAALTIAGKGGVGAIVVVTFMAVTSTLSAQVIAVSSIISFDIYRTYLRPNATDRDVINISHYGVIFFALVAAAFSTLLHYVGADLNWTLYMLGESSNGKAARFLADYSRGTDMPWHLPNNVHDLVALAKQGCSDHISSVRNGYRYCSLAGQRLWNLW